MHFSLRNHLEQESCGEPVFFLSVHVFQFLQGICFIFLCHIVEQFFLLAKARSRRLSTTLVFHIIQILVLTKNHIDPQAQFQIPGKGAQWSVWGQLCTAGTIN